VEDDGAFSGIIVYAPFQPIDAQRISETTMVRLCGFKGPDA
jgi:hypothetical protein